MFRKLCLLLVAISGLSACSDAKRDSFVANCKEKGESETACDCIYSVAQKDLDGKQLDLFIAISTQDKKLENEVTEEMGTISQITATAKIGVVMGKAAAGCNVKL